MTIFGHYRDKPAYRQAGPQYGIMFFFEIQEASIMKIKYNLLFFSLICFFMLLSGNGYGMSADDYYTRE
jgi:hypothetical protein